jgi:hypothetical protein
MVGGDQARRIGFEVVGAVGGGTELQPVISVAGLVVGDEVGEDAAAVDGGSGPTRRDRRCPRRGPRS